MTLFAVEPTLGVTSEYVAVAVPPLWMAISPDGESAHTGVASWMSMSLIEPLKTPVLGPVSVAVKVLPVVSWVVLTETCTVLTALVFQLRAIVVLTVVLEVWTTVIEPVWVAEPANALWSVYMVVVSVPVAGAIIVMSSMTLPSPSVSTIGLSPAVRTIV